MVPENLKPGKLYKWKIPQKPPVPFSYYPSRESKYLTYGDILMYLGVNSKIEHDNFKILNEGSDKFFSKRYRFLDKDGETCILAAIECVGLESI